MDTGLVLERAFDLAQKLVAFRLRNLEIKVFAAPGENAELIPLLEQMRVAQSQYAKLCVSHQAIYSSRRNEVKYLFTKQSFTDSHKLLSLWLSESQGEISSIEELKTTLQEIVAELPRTIAQLNIAIADKKFKKRLKIAGLTTIGVVVGVAIGVCCWYIPVVPVMAGVYIGAGIAGVSAIAGIVLACLVKASEELTGILNQFTNILPALQDQSQALLGTCAAIERFREVMTKAQDIPEKEAFLLQRHKARVSEGICCVLAKIGDQVNVYEANRITMVTPHEESDVKIGDQVNVYEANRIAMVTPHEESDVNDRLLPSDSDSETPPSSLSSITLDKINVRKSDCESLS